MNRRAQFLATNLTTLLCCDFTVEADIADNVTIYYSLGEFRLPTLTLTRKQFDEISMGDLCAAILTIVSPRIEGAVRQRIRELKGDTKASL